MSAQETNENRNQQGIAKPTVATDKPSSNGKILLIVIIIVIASGLGVLAVQSKLTGSEADTGGTVAARRGDLAITVTEGGSIRANKSITYSCEVERRGGSLTILNIVPAGTYVTQEDVDNGMILVELDSSALKDQLLREKTSLANDEESMTSAMEAYDIQQRQNESDIASNQLKLRFALLALQKYLGNALADKMIEDANNIVDLTAHVAPFLSMVREDPNLLDGSSSGQDLKRLNDNIILAEGNLKTSLATLAGTEELHKASYVSNLDLDRDRLTVVNRQFSLEDAQVNWDLFLRYDFPKNAEQFLSDYIEAGRQLDRTFAQCRSRISQAQARLLSAKESLESQKRTVEWIEGLIDKCTIRAKAPGLVIYGTGGSGDAWAAMRGRGGGSGIIAPGESVFERQVLISMPDTATMIAEIGVHETEVDKVRPGQTARIIMDAFPDKVLTGQVISVAPLPDEQRGFMNPDLKVYKTLVMIDGTHEFLRTRMSCKVEIFVQQLKNIITVPIQVVANRKGRKVVFVMEKGQPVEREVTTGAFNDIFVQIVEGLDEGEEILLNPPLFNETDQSVSGQSTETSSDDDQTTPNQAAPQVQTPGQAGDQQPGRGGPSAQPQGSGDGTGENRQNRGGFGGTRNTMPDGTPITDEMRQQFRQRMQSGEMPTTLPDGTPITDEMRQRFRDRMNNAGGGQSGGQGGGFRGNTEGGGQGGGFRGNSEGSGQDSGQQGQRRRQQSGNNPTGGQGNPPANAPTN